MPQTSAKPKCVRPDCGKRANQECERRLWCKQCCLKAGGCSANGHDLPTASKQSTTAPSALPTHAHSVPPTCPTLSASPALAPPSLASPVTSNFMGGSLPTVYEDPSDKLSPGYPRFKTTTTSAPSPSSSAVPSATPTLGRLPATISSNISLPAAPSQSGNRITQPSRSTSEYAQRPATAEAGSSHARHKSHMKAIDIASYDRAQADVMREHEIQADRTAMKTQVDNQIKVTVWKTVCLRRTSSMSESPLTNAHFPG